MEQNKPNKISDEEKIAEFFRDKSEELQKNIITLRADPLASVEFLDELEAASEHLSLAADIYGGGNK